MNQKSLKDLKSLAFEFTTNPKLIERLDNITVRYAEIMEKLENPETKKERKQTQK